MDGGQCFVHHPEIVQVGSLKLPKTVIRPYPDYSRESEFQPKADEVEIRP